MAFGRYEAEDDRLSEGGMSDPARDRGLDTRELRGDLLVYARYFQSQIDQSPAVSRVEEPGFVEDVLRRHLPIALHEGHAAHCDLAGLTGRQDRPALWIDDADLHARKRAPGVAGAVTRARSRGIVRGRSV